MRGVKDAPGVLSTIRWLLRMSETTPPHIVLRRALSSGLVREEAPAHWHASDSSVARLLARSSLVLPRSPKALASLLLGFGEFAARSHDDREMLLDAVFKHSAKGQEKEILFAAFDETVDNARSVSLADHSAAQSLTATNLSWELFAIADVLAQSPMGVSTTPRYGLEAIVQQMLAWKPSAVRALVERDRDHPVMSAVVRAAVQHLHPLQLERVRAVVATQCPLLVCMAAARMAEPSTESAAATTRFADGWRLLVGTGIAEADAIWLMALQLKEAVHQRFRLIDRIKGDIQLLRWLNRKSPDLSDYERHRFQQVSDELPRMQEASTRHEEALDHLLEDMARLWPASGLSQVQYRFLAPSFVDSAEIRHRLAIKIQVESERVALLKQNIDVWKHEIGVGLSADKVFAEEYHPQVDRLVEQTLWVARSFVALHQTKAGGAGRPTSLLIAQLKADAEAILEQPFMAVRQSARWQAALLRSAACAVFALIVVVETPAQQRANVSILRSYALDHARQLLHQAERIGASWELLDRLASIAIGMMADDPAEASQLAAWADDLELSAMVRATAAWSSRDYLMTDIASASRLFTMAAKPPLLRAARDRHFDQVMSMLDIAVVEALRGGGASIADELRRLWNQAMTAWPEHAEEWDVAADWLIRAVQGEGPERAALLAHSSFANSRCRGAC